MTQTTYNDNVLIDGSQDAKQLRVQGNAIQDQPLQTWEDSAGNILTRVTGDGRIQTGDDVGFPSPDALVEVHRASSSTKPQRGIHSLGQVSGALDNPVQWMIGELELWGSSAINALLTTFRIRATNKNTGTPTLNAELRAADIEVVNDAAAGTAALTNATGLQVGVTNANGKTITNAIGIKVKMNNAGSIANPFAIYTEGSGVTHLEDYVEVKQPAAVPGTPATDFMRLYPKADGKLYAKNWSGTEYDLTGGTGSSPSLAGICFGRLTLASATPVTPDDVTSPTLYFSPFRGNQVALYNGSTWTVVPFTERSLDVTALQINTAYDIFLYDSGGGILALEAVPWNTPATGSITSISTARVVTVASHSLTTGQLVTITGNAQSPNNAVWRVGTTTTTTFQLLNLDGTTPAALGSAGAGGTWSRADQSTSRVTNLALQDGVWVKSGTPARRYLGTIRTFWDAPNTRVACEDSVKRRFVYNEANPVIRNVKALDIAQWTYTANAWRAAKNNLADRVEVVVGNRGPLVDLRLNVRIISGGPGVAHGIAVDATNTSNADVVPAIDASGNVSAYYQHVPTVGYHFYQWVENGRGSASCTVYGNVLQSGMVGAVML
jgi:hypothetical protein